MNIIEYHKKRFIRKTVAKDLENLYIFTDNTDRTSGRVEINRNSDYCKRFWVGCCYPSVTSASIRGLDNACPITTQRYYNEHFNGPSGRWHDKDFFLFKKVIDDDFDAIKRYCAEKNPRNVILPPGGIFNSSIANISKERTPILYEYLINKLHELENYNP